MARRQVPLESGERDRRVTLRRVTQSVGASGFPVDTDGTSVTMWASRADMGARERFLVEQISAAADTRWEVNYRPDLDPELVDVPRTWKLLANGRVHDIVAASVIGRREGIELLTLAKVG
jgi:head-tail adaptor